jgi:hypothetical protein
MFIVKVDRRTKEGRVGGKRWMEEVGILRTGGQIAQRRLEKVGDLRLTWRSRGDAQPRHAARLSSS